MTKEEFIVKYLDDYVRMAYRKLTFKVNIDEECKLINILYNLLDRYVEGELANYIYYNKIV
ncbi:MAG: hypothetical protein NC310_09200 [Roseburia sp.]|nr:hypothetical protein [Roseburia sp.]